MPSLRSGLDAVDALAEPDSKEGGLPLGWSIYEAAQIGVTNYPDDPNGRPHNIVENEEEIKLLFEERPQPTVVCGYCGDTYRTRSLDWALTWFRHGHECASVALPLAA